MLGEMMALGAALTSSVSVILFKRSEAISPLGLNLFKNVADTILLAVTLVLLGEGMDLERSTEDWLRLAASGVLSEPQRPKGPQRREGDGLAISASFAYALHGGRDGAPVERKVHRAIVRCAEREGFAPGSKASCRTSEAMRAGVEQGARRVKECAREVERCARGVEDRARWVERDRAAGEAFWAE